MASLVGGLVAAVVAVVVKPVVAVVEKAVTVYTETEGQKKLRLAKERKADKEREDEADEIDKQMKEAGAKKDDGGGKAKGKTKDGASTGTPLGKRSREEDEGEGTESAAVSPTLRAGSSTPESSSSSTSPSGSKKQKTGHTLPDVRVRRTKATAFGKSAGVHYTEHTGKLTNTGSNLQLELLTTTVKHGSPITKLAKHGLESQSVVGLEDITDKPGEVCYRFRVLGTKHKHVDLACASAEDKQLWIAAIRKAVNC